MGETADPRERRITELEREIRLLREEASQSRRIRRMWEESLAQLKQAREELLATQRELEGANAELESRVEELRRAKEYVEHVAYSDKQVIEHMLEGVVTTDIDGVILGVNPAFTHVTGYPAEEVIGRTPRVLKSGRHGDAFYAELWGELITTGRWQGEVWNRRKSGEVYPELLSISAIKDWRGETINYIGVFTDISEQKSYQDELIGASRRAMEASRLKSQFLANMSHEVRTPMNAIIGMADLLAEADLDAESRHYLNIMRSAGDLLLTLIDDILDLAKVEAGQLELERVSFDLQDVIDDVIEVLGVRARDKRVELHSVLDPGVPDWVVSDPVRIRQVLLNLVGNAVKFTEQGSVEVRVSRVAGAEGVLEFVVRDTGIGIPESRINTIFSAFTQADAGITRKYGGTGLGLTICQRLVELMGGSIWVESEEGRGSTFYFTIPAETGVPASRSVSLERLKGARIMVIGGSPASRLIARSPLEAAGADVEEVAEGERAMEALLAQSGTPDVVVLDAVAGRTVCVEMVQRIRDESSLAALPLVVLGFGERRGDARKVREMGVNYLLKPVKRREFLRAVARSMDEGDGTEARAGIHGIKILLVEDSEDNALLIRAYLKDSGHQIDYAPNGAVAVKRVEEEEYDLVLMDVQMPVMDGYEATRRIRDLERESSRGRVPIIALTAHAMKEDEKRSLEAGCDAHLSKPIRKADLLRALARHAVPP